MLSRNCAGLLGPRALILFWWLIFNTFLWPALGGYGNRSCVSGFARLSLMSEVVGSISAAFGDRDAATVRPPDGMGTHRAPSDAGGSRSPDEDAFPRPGGKEGREFLVSTPPVWQLSSVDSRPAIDPVPRAKR
jgi:hypothetical protein